MLEDVYFVGIFGDSTGVEVVPVGIAATRARCAVAATSDQSGIAGKGEGNAVGLAIA